MCSLMYYCVLRNSPNTEGFCVNCVLHGIIRGRRVLHEGMGESLPQMFLSENSYVNGAHSPISVVVGTLLK